MLIIMTFLACFAGIHTSHVSAEIGVMASPPAQVHVTHEPHYPHSFRHHNRANRPPGCYQWNPRRGAWIHC